MKSRARIREMSRATCRGTRTRGGGEVVDDEPARGGVVDDEPARCVVVDDEPVRGGVINDEPARHGVVDDERHDDPRDELRDVPRHPDARRCRSSRRRAMSRATCRGTQTRGVGELVDDEPRDMPRHPDAWHRRSRAGAIRTTSTRAARCSDRTHDESQCDRPTRSRAARWCVRMHGIGAVESVQVGRRVVAAHGVVDVEPVRPGDE
jgi:hypothetical protein